MRRLRTVLPLALLAAAVITAAAAAFGFNDPPPPNGTVGQPYSYQFVPTNAGPGYEFTYRISSGSLPPGISLSSSGRLSGTPTQAGGWSFYLEAYYTWSGTTSAPSQRQYSIGVVEGLAVQQTSLPTMTTGTPFSTQLTATGGGTQSWSVVSGALPTGLALASNGVLSGTPTAPGTFTFTVRVTSGSRIDDQAFTVEVIQALAATTPRFPPAVVGSDFNASYTASGGRAPYTWSIAEGTWPRGLAFNGGVISGRPRVAGSYAFSVRVTDALGNTLTLPSTLVVQPRLKIPLQTLRAGTVGRRYAAKVLVKGGAKPYTFELADGNLPRGLRLNVRTGLISGTPRAKGRASFVVVVADQVGGTHQRRLVLRVR
jgi:hypothetical protein